MSWQTRADIGTLESAPPPPPPVEMSVEDALLLALRMAALHRVVTEPGSGDRAFLRDIRGKRLEALTERQIAHVQRLAWRYRHQLAPMLRPAENPDQEAKS